MLDAQDYFEIQQLYAAYGHTIDSADFQGWANLYTEDGVWERVDQLGGPAVFSVEGRANLAAFAEEDYAGRGAGMGRHWMGNILLDGAPPRVHGRTYGFLIQSIDGDIRWIAHGNFDDQLVKLDEGWRFERRTLWPLGPLEIPSEANRAQ